MTIHVMHSKRTLTSKMAAEALGISVTALRQAARSLGNVGEGVRDMRFNSDDLDRICEHLGLKK